MIPAPLFLQVVNTLSEFVSILQSSSLALGIAVFLTGLCVGSFLNVVIHRLPLMMERQWKAECAALDGREPAPEPPLNLVTPPSRCPSCAAPVRAWQNIPVASWLALRGKCASCKAPISARYPMVEILGGALAVLVAWRFGYSAALAAGLVYAWALLALTFIDFDTQLLPDDITLPLLWLGLLVNSRGVFTDLQSAVLGAAGGYLILWSVYWAFRLIAKKEGMGYGDFKLLAAIGAWTGWQILPFVVVVSAGLGAVIGSFLLWRSKSGTQTPIPFGPYLALGGIGALLWGREAITAWLGRFPA
jgi:leader peptidase (prepilin peptidase)/N-methyltransferase